MIIIRITIMIMIITVFNKYNTQFHCINLTIYEYNKKVFFKNYKTRLKILSFLYRFNEKGKKKEWILMIIITTTTTNDLYTGAFSRQVQRRLREIENNIAFRNNTLKKHKNESQAILSKTPFVLAKF